MKGEVYIPVECRVSLFFKAGHIECDFCHLLQIYDRKEYRRECRRTGELLLPGQLRGIYCPLEIPGELLTDTATGAVIENKEDKDEGL